jgi:hypothetical protein
MKEQVQCTGQAVLQLISPSSSSPFLHDPAAYLFSTAYSCHFDYCSAQRLLQTMVEVLVEARRKVPRRIIKITNVLSATAQVAGPHAAISSTAEATVADVSHSGLAAAESPAATAFVTDPSEQEVAALQFDEQQQRCRNLLLWLDDLRRKLYPELYPQPSSAAASATGPTSSRHPCRVRCMHDLNLSRCYQADNDYDQQLYFATCAALSAAELKLHKMQAAAEQLHQDATNHITVRGFFV